MRAIGSFLALQSVWFACVLGAAHGYPWLGPPLALGLLGLHIRMQSSGCRLREAVFLLASALLGFTLDTALLQARVFQILGDATSPPWLVVLWPTLAAATAPRASLAGFAQRPLLSGLLAAVGGALSYNAGASLSALNLGESKARSLGIIAVVWFLVLPGLFALRRRLGLSAMPGADKTLLS